MKQTLSEALDHIHDRHLQEAAIYRKKRFAPWLGAVAAVLVVGICLGILYKPAAADPIATLGSPVVLPMEGGGSILWGSRIKYEIAKPVYPILSRNPALGDMYSYEAWHTDQKAIHDQPAGYADNLQDYFARSTALLLGNSGGENVTCSPLNIYMALAMLAEVTDGESRRQLLTLLNSDSIEALRTQARRVWQGHYNADGLTTSVLGSSLWVDSDYTCLQECADVLAEHYFASVFHGDLGSDEMDEALRSWLSQQTGQLLDGYVQDISLDARTALALASTVYYQVQWMNEPFREEDTTQATFHGLHGDTTEDFMHTTLTYGPYYWADRFGAVTLRLEDGSAMWLFLPDEGVTPEQLMGEGDIFQFLAQDPQAYDTEYTNSKGLIINLSLPKFDIASRTALVQQLQALGVTDVFTKGVADFSPILAEKDGGYVTDVTHAARVAIDEKGVTAAAFTLILRAGAGMPPQDEMDLTFDRPFAFLIESPDGLPLFAGIVNQP